jgi:hypothetical protein
LQVIGKDHIGSLGISYPSSLSTSLPAIISDASERTEISTAHHSHTSKNQQKNVKRKKQSPKHFASTHFSLWKYDL